MSIERSVDVNYTSASIGKPLVPWRNPHCGGKRVNGSQDCNYDDEAVLDCHCVIKPKNFNYLVNYQLLQEVFYYKLHIKKSEPGTVLKWDEMTNKMFTTGAFRCYQPVSLIHKRSMY